jgi:hypothetical protein
MEGKLDGLYLKVAMILSNLKRPKLKWGFGGFGLAPKTNGAAKPKKSHINYLGPSNIIDFVSFSLFYFVLPFLNIFFLLQIESQKLIILAQRVFC